MKKLLLVSSPGGHSIQLGFVFDFLSENNNFEIVKFICDGEVKKINGRKISIVDFNMNSFWKIPLALIGSYKLIKATDTGCVLSTGAAPGLIACFVAKFTGCKTIWVDSIANTKKLSLSGKLSRFFCDEVYTQWPSLKDKKVKYIGSLL